MAKKIELIPNSCGGLDLGTERDAGNPVRILTGNESLKFWKALNKASEQAIVMIKENQKAKKYNGK